MKRILPVSLYILSVLSGGFFCASPDLTGGTSSTDNGKIAGVIFSKENSPAPNAMVRLRPSDFVPDRDADLPDIDTTDAEGRYEFDGLVAGIYTIEAIGIQSGKRALVNSVTVDSGTTHAATASLANPGALEIQVPDCPDSVCFLYIPGTSLSGDIRNGIAFIDSVPAGVIPAVCYANPDEPSTIRYIASDILVSEGVIRRFADYSEWKYSRKIILNTTLSGACITSNVYNFPVLIRLSDPDFNFTQAQSDGSDIRFKKQDGTPVPYEIERWQPADGSAEIWVKIDTVFGNDSTRFFTMYWGNSYAEPKSNSTAVFDTIDGFQGVWHLGNEESSVRDATGNHYDGTATDISSVNSPTGAAYDFNGTSSFISMPSTADSKLDFPQNGTYSLSLWVYADTLDATWRAIAGKGHEQYYLQLKGLGEGRGTWEFVEFQDNRGWEYNEDSVPSAPGAGEWLHIVGVRSGTSQFLYLNGRLVVNTPSLMPGEHPRDHSDDFTIGRFGTPVTIPREQGWSYFNGKIDEVRVANVALTADRIYLSYKNQKADNTLVVFR